VYHNLPQSSRIMRRPSDEESAGRRHLGCSLLIESIPGRFREGELGHAPRSGQ